MSGPTIRTRHYVEFLMPGSFFPEESIAEVSIRDPGHAVKQADPNVFAFTFFTVREVVIDGDLFRTKNLDRSARYYIGGKLYSLDEVKALRPSEKYETLVRNMEGNRWKKMIKCRVGNWQVFEDGDTLLQEGSE